ncbi:aromatase/cyclase [Streptomyces sp. NPDC058657]|uniref:aromatase/cyclase n=1 Tax=unclassified Streptomyces TaxID=2593676 RepID=UPI003659CF08
MTTLTAATTAEPGPAGACATGASATPAADGRIHRTVHTTDVAAPAGAVYGLIADTTKWPLFFGPNVHVERLAFDGTDEHLAMWATANGRVRHWTSRRRLDAAARRVAFRQELPAPPLSAMSGAWVVEPLGAERARLTLLHDFSVPGDRAEDVAWVERATDTNSRAELANIARLGERWARLDELVLSFEDSVHVAAPPEPVYGFLQRVADWQRLLPHVARLEVSEEGPVQVMAMDTLTADGAAHTTESVRVCFPESGRIVYKQTRTPALMEAHTGCWTVTGDADGTTVTSQHSVIVREENITAVLGEEAGIADARTYLRQALGRNSTATLHHAKRYAEGLSR